MNISVLRARVGPIAPRRMRNVANPWRQRGEDRVEVIYGVPRSADHHAITAIDAPDAAGGAAIDVTDALLGEHLGPPDIVLVEGVSAVDDHVARGQQPA